MAQKLLFFIHRSKSRCRIIIIATTTILELSKEWIKKSDQDTKQKGTEWEKACRMQMLTGLGGG